MSNASIQALRERLQDNSRQARHLLAEKGSATWSDDDQAKYDGLMDEAERIDRQIKAHQRLLDQEAEDSFKDMQRKPGGAANSADDKTKGFELFLRKSFREMNHEEVALVRNTMSTSTGSEGGYTVQPQVASTFVETLKAYGAMRRVSDRLVTSNGADLSYPTTDGTAEKGEIIAQNASSASLDVSFGTVALNTFKFGSKIITVPIELLQDSNIDIVSLVWGRARTRIGRIQNDMYTTGSNSGQPNGVITAASVGKTGAAGQVTSIIYDDLVDLVDSLDDAYLDGSMSDQRADNIGPAFQTTQTMRRVIRKIKDTAGRPIFTPSYDEGGSSATPDRVLGYPLVINNSIAVPAASAKSLAFGNFRNYMVRDTLDVMLLRFEDSVYMSKGQVGFLAIQRSGGNLLDTAAVKVYQHPAS